MLSLNTFTEKTNVTWFVPRCLKEDPATMSLLQRSLDPEKTLGLVDVLYTAVLDLNRWRVGRLVSLHSLEVAVHVFCILDPQPGAIHVCSYHRVCGK